MYPTLTKKQKDILEYIKVYTQLHGYSPSLEEIKGQFRLSAISTVHEHIQNLKKKGYIHNEINQARSLRPIDPNLREKEFTEVPLVYALTNKDVLEINKNQKTIPVAKELLTKSGTFIGLIVDTTTYVEHGILPGDILILKESPDIKTTSLVIVTTKANRVYLYKASPGGKFEPIIKQQPALKNLCLKAVICDLIRKY